MPVPRSHPPPTDLAYFLTIPWCAAHLSSPKVVPTQPIGRRNDGRRPPGSDDFIAEALYTPDTIPHFMLFYTVPASPTGILDEMGAFMTLGAKLDGWPGTAHGGAVMTVLDEVMGMLFPINMRLGRMPRASVMTAYLNTRFVRPVATRATVLVKSRLVGVEGRKYFVEGEVRNEKGTVLATAESMFLVTGVLKDRL